MSKAKENQPPATASIWAAVQQYADPKHKRKLLLVPLKPNFMLLFLLLKL